MIYVVARKMGINKYGIQLRLEIDLEMHIKTRSQTTAAHKSTMSAANETDTNDAMIAMHRDGLTLYSCVQFKTKNEVHKGVSIVCSHE